MNRLETVQSPVFENDRRSLCNLLLKITPRFLTNQRNYVDGFVKWGTLLDSDRLATHQLLLLLLSFVNVVVSVLTAPIKTRCR